MSPKFREVLYKLGTAVFAVVSLLSTFHIIRPEDGSAISVAVTAILGLFGVTVAGTAAYNVSKQRQDGVFDPGAEVAPEERVITGLQEVLANQQSAQAAVERVKDAVSTVTKDVPVLGPLAQQQPHPAGRGMDQHRVA